MLGRIPLLLQLRGFLRNFNGSRWVGSCFVERLDVQGCRRGCCRRGSIVFALLRVLTQQLRIIDSLPLFGIFGRQRVFPPCSSFSMITTFPRPSRLGRWNVILQLLIIDFPPSALGMFLRAPYACREVLLAVHVKSPAAITRRLDAITSLKLLHPTHHLCFVGSAVVEEAIHDRRFGVGEERGRCARDRDRAWGAGPEKRVGVIQVYPWLGFRRARPTLQVRERRSS